VRPSLLSFKSFTFYLIHENNIFYDLSAPGKTADIVVVNGNPVARLKGMEKVETVFQRWGWL
jgi:hypothetical protein